MNDTKTVTSKLRDDYGLDPNQIKRINNYLHYRGMTFNRVTRVNYLFNSCGAIVIRFTDDNFGDIIEFEESDLYR